MGRGRQLSAPSACPSCADLPGMDWWAIVPEKARFSPKFYLAKVNFHLLFIFMCYIVFESVENLVTLSEAKGLA